MNLSHICNLVMTKETSFVNGIEIFVDGGTAQIRACVRPKAIPEHMSGLAFGLRVFHWQLTPSGGERAVSVLMFG
jgi:hypothetical protein